MIVDGAPEPLAGAEEVAAVDLGDVLDAVAGRDGEVDRLAACASASASSDGRASSTTLRSTQTALGDAEDRRTGAQPPALAVLLDETLALERAHQPRRGALRDSAGGGKLGRARPAGLDSRTRTSSSAPRSTAVVPREAASRRSWNCCSTVDILGPRPAASSASICCGGPPSTVAHPATSRRKATMFVNAMPRYEILSEEAMATLDRGWRRIVSELGIEFLLPEAVELLRGAGQIVEDENRVRFDPEFILEQVAKAPAGVRAAGAQPGQQRPHRRRSHGVRARLRLPVHPRGRRAPRREDGRLREPGAPRPGLPGARLAGRHDLRARGPAAGLPPPRHGLRAADAVGQAVHGLGHLGSERRRHDPDGGDPVRRPGGDRARTGVDLA